MKHNDIDIDEIIEDAQSNLAFNGVYRKREERAGFVRQVLIIVSVILFCVIILTVCMCEKVPV